jgi:hypothetical protein
MDEAKKKDKQGRFKPKTVFVGVHIPEGLRDDLNIKARMDHIPVRAIATALFELYVTGEIRLEKEN